MAKESEKKAKARTGLARAFVTQFLPSVFFFLALYRVLRRAQGAHLALALLGAAAGALGGLVCLPEALGQAHFLGLPSTLRLPEALGGPRAVPAGAAWGVRAAAAAALLAPLAAALWLPWRASPLHGWLDAICALLSLALALPVAHFYVDALAEDAAGDGKGNPHLENMLALCMLTPLLAAFSPRAWLALILIPPYAAYLVYSMFAGAAGMLKRQAAAQGGGAEVAAALAAAAAAGKGGSSSSSSSSSSSKKQHAPGTHRR